MILQLIICTCIYALFFLIKNNENNFSKQTVENVSKVLSYDINFKKIYTSCEEYFKNQKFFKLNEDKSNKEEIEKNQNEEITENKEITENENKENEDKENEDNNGVGGGEIPQEQIQESNKSQMEIDSEYIKQSYNLVIPVNGNITSAYGSREPTEIISAFHQGIDIGASTRNTNLCFYGRKCNCCIICWRLWKSHKNSEWRCYNCICTLQ